ncbi:hypothetical protein [Stenotrophomonas sp.]|uniref:hypothetical protein n=1 Tax=Stenotrophomonas sp. TaxID=69392 RepID=UPI0028A94E48|nr:hypothetical protein [Stenotrophomonas sp.]
MKHYAIAAAFLLTSPAAAASNNDQDAFHQRVEVPAGVEDQTDLMQLASRALPAGVNLREIFRLYKRGQHHTTLFYFPQNWGDINWSVDGTLGFISATAFENSRPLYMCQLNNIHWGYFTSADVACEGHFLTVFGQIGYISTVPLPNTAPLYRCNYIHKRQLKHFDTLQANCENVALGTNDGPLGYVFL